VVASLSNGEIVLFSEGPTSTEVGRWHAHDFEPWTCAFDYWKPDVVWTGGPFPVELAGV
jgi:diphthamide biosynthesis protein 7